MTIDRQIIKDDKGRILGTIFTHHNGDKIAKDFYGKIVGTYNKSSNLTKDFYGRIVSKGDILAGLLYRK